MRTLIVALAFFVFLWGTVFAEDKIVLHGSSTLTGLITPHKTDIELKTGVQFDLVGFGTGRGILDLIQRHADGALASASLAQVLAVTKVDTTGVELVENIVHQQPIHCMANDSIPLKKITVEQATKIWTGEINNWSQLGGPNAEIIVISPLPGDGARATFNPYLPKGAELTLAARIVRNSADVATQVAKTPNSFGITGVPIGAGGHNLDTEQTITQTFCIITMGKPTDQMQLLIQNIRLSLNPSQK